MCHIKTHEAISEMQYLKWNSGACSSVISVQLLESFQILKMSAVNVSEAGNTASLILASAANSNSWVLGLNMGVFIFAQL